MPDKNSNVLAKPSRRRQYLRLDTIINILYSSSKTYCRDEYEQEIVKTLAVRDSIHYQIDEGTLLRWEKPPYNFKTVAYILQKGAASVEPRILLQLLKWRGYGRALLENCQDLPPEIINEVLVSDYGRYPYVRDDAAKWCKGKPIPSSMIQEWLKSIQYEPWAAALYATIGQDYLPQIDGGWEQYTKNGLTRRAFLEKLVSIPNLKRDVLEQLCNGNFKTNILAMEVIGQRKGFVDLLYDGIQHPEIYVRLTAAKAFYGKRISLGKISELRYDHPHSLAYRAAAMYASAGRDDVPKEWIESCLTDSSENVRTAARFAAAHRPDIAPYRVINPGDKVYKKCIGGVIVVAEIPKSADIRGGVDNDGQRKYRASQAKIIDIIGDFYGEKVGVAYYDGKTQYRIGDQIKINNFDYSDEICSTGFHFFLSKEEAEWYR